LQHQYLPHLLEKLTTKEELSGLLNWALEGLHRLLRTRGFSKNISPEETKELYELYSNPYASFMTTCLFFIKEDYVETGKRNAFDAFLKFCAVIGFAPVSYQWFNTQLKQVIPDLQDDRTPEYPGGPKIPVWKGFYLFCRVLRSKDSTDREENKLFDGLGESVQERIREKEEAGLPFCTKCQYCPPAIKDEALQQRRLEDFQRQVEEENEDDTDISTLD